MTEMNRHERTFRSAGRALLILFGLWILCIASIFLAPPNIQESDWRYIAGVAVLLSLIAGMFALGILRMVAYIRWTGRYPYYFLFRSSRERVQKLSDEAGGPGPKNKK